MCKQLEHSSTVCCSKQPEDRVDSWLEHGIDQSWIAEVTDLLAVQVHLNHAYDDV